MMLRGLRKLTSVTPIKPNKLHQNHTTFLRRFCSAQQNQSGDLEYNTRIPESQEPTINEKLAADFDKLGSGKQTQMRKYYVDEQEQTKSFSFGMLDDLKDCMVKMEKMQEIFEKMEEKIEGMENFRNHDRAYIKSIEAELAEKNSDLTYTKSLEVKLEKKGEEFDLLKCKFLKVERELEVQARQCTELLDENAKLLQQNAEKVEFFGDKNAKLEQENAELIYENAKLEQDAEDKARQCTELINENTKLMDENAKLEQDAEDRMKEHKEKIATIEKALEELSEKMDIFVQERSEEGSKEKVAELMRVLEEKDAQLKQQEEEIYTLKQELADTNINLAETQGVNVSLVRSRANHDRIIRNLRRQIISASYKQKAAEAKAAKMDKIKDILKLEFEEEELEEEETQDHTLESEEEDENIKSRELKKRL